MWCEDCKFATWNRTKTGRLSPTGQGVCDWTKTVQVAWSSWQASRAGNTVVGFEGGTIWRKTDPTGDCPVFELPNKEALK